MVQFIGKVVDPKGNPCPDLFMLVTLDEDRLDQIMYRICEVDDQSDDDSDLIESNYHCPFIEVFKPSSKALRQKLERLFGLGTHAVIYKNFVKVPAKTKIPLATATTRVVPGAAGFAATFRSGEEVQIDYVPGDLWEAAVNILLHNKGIENPSKEPAPKKRRSYFS